MRLAVGFALGGGAARAAEPAVAAGASFAPRPVAGHPVFELRAGAGGGVEGPNAMICVEGSPHRWVALEACGTGGGFLYPEVGNEMMHLRAEASIPLLEAGRLGLWFQPGLGMAEIQAGADEPGFRFGPANTPTQRDGAGAEAALSLKARVWPTRHLYVTTEVSAGAAWIEAAPVVLEQNGPLVPFATGTVGVGF